MGGVGLRFSTELRARWRAWLGLAVVLGLAGAAVLALVAGARRTESAYDRFLRAQVAYDAMVVNDRGSFFDSVPTSSTYDAELLRSLPQVVDMAESRQFFAYIGAGVGVLVPRDERIGTEINRFKLLAGRRPDPADPTEVVVGFTFAEEQEVSVGDRITLFDPNLFGEPPPDRRLDAQAASRRILGALPGGEATVVGIEASPGEFPPQIVGPDRYLIHASPALYTLAPDLAGFSSGGDTVMVRLARGDADVDAFLAELQRRGAGQQPDVVVQRDRTASVERSIHIQAMALWLLALLTAAAGALIGGQLLARMTMLESVDHPTLSALGMSRSQRFGLGLLRGGIIGAVAGVLAASAALVASALFPLGLGATAEPTPGVHLDGLVITLGGSSITLVVVALTAWPAWRAERGPAVGRVGHARAARRPARSRSLSEPALSVPMGAGIRMAFERGRGEGAAPVLSGLVGITLGVTMLVAALAFGANLRHLLSTPRLYGQTWDATLTTYNDDIARQGAPVLSDDDRVDAVGVGTPWLQLTIHGRRVDGLAVDAVDGTIGPAILEGRAPRGESEIAVGTRTLRSLGLHIGDAVDVGVFATDRPATRVHIVGRVVFPLFGDAGRLGDGIAMIVAGAEQVTGAPSETVRNAVFVRLVDDDPSALDAVVEDLSPHILAPAGAKIAVTEQGRPTDIVNFGRIDSTPYLLAAVFAVLAASTLTYLLLTSAFRRRRDYATLKALGLVRRQIRATVRWQATALTLAALLIALPLGIALGRAAWRVFADGLGVVAQTTTPWTALVTVVPTALVVANVIASIPATAAARLDAAATLRDDSPPA